jgi:hypothetical protein
MSTHPAEYQVYLRIIDFLQAKRWTIVCASPPGGTDNRFRKCLLPRRDLGSSIRGPRDEVDVTAHNGAIILLAECKSTLSDSFTVLNALGESDYDKLKRLAGTFTPTELAALIQRGTGLPLPTNPIIGLALVVGVVNHAIPPDMSVFEVGDTIRRLWAVEPLAGVLKI